MNIVMKLVEIVLEKKITRLAFVDEMQFGFMLVEEQLMLYLSREGCRKSIMLKEKSHVCVLHMFCVGMGNEE